MTILTIALATLCTIVLFLLTFGFIALTVIARVSPPLFEALIHAAAAELAAMFYRRTP